MPLAKTDAQRLAVTLSAAGTQTDTVATWPFEIFDVNVVATATQSGGTLKIARGVSSVFTDITDAMTCAAQHDIARCSKVVQTAAVFAIGDTLRAIPAGAATNGVVNCSISPRPTPGA